MDYQSGMYVRFPFDYEYDNDPREFLMGQVYSVNELKNTAIVKVRDPFGYRKFYDYICDEYEVSLFKLDRCTSGLNVHVKYKLKECVVLACETENALFTYYMQDVSSKEIIVAAEKDVDIPFNCMDISPLVQFKKYEFQNPAWYIGRSIVSKSMNVLNNSISGFTELAGCKIELLPHQLLTIMRCLQSSPCRYMLADEVGMGKTIEALGVLKIYCNTHANKEIVIVVPSALEEQWKNEMLFKFDLAEHNPNNNRIVFVNSDTLSSLKRDKYDFLIVDEVHHYLKHEEEYGIVYEISNHSENVLLLSATPVQEKGTEYLRLLRLLNPKQYNDTSLDSFEALVEKQRKIVKQVHYAYSSLADMIEQRDYLVGNNLNPLDDQDMHDIFDELKDQLSELGSVLKDEKFNSLLERIVFEDKNYSVARIKALLVYTSERYQIDENVIRNRRRLLKDKIAERKVTCVIHNTNETESVYEKQVYNRLYENIASLELSYSDIERDIVPLIEAFFSSSMAFSKQLNSIKSKYKFEDALVSDTENWVNSERRIINDFVTCMDESSHVSRICDVIERINDIAGRDKVVLFTDFEETLIVYKTCLEQYFGSECVAVYYGNMDPDEREANVYRFQYLDDCQFLLCDSSGGEGKNFQNAKIVVHLDLPWDAVALEQRIGRLDRLGRNPELPVISLVVYDEKTIEETLFKVFNDGLNVFTKSLSGLEIVVGELNQLLVKSLAVDFNYGLEEALHDVIRISAEMNEEIKSEQIYDVAGFEFKPLTRKISKSVQRLYAQNDSILQTAMIGWSSLTGFKEVTNKDGVCSFSSGSFSYGSAIKTLLIPPRWDLYKNDERITHIERIRALTSVQGKSKDNHVQWIRGTFDRELAIKSDYLHFFAPGDPIFDCIVYNAMNCYKGRCSAMQIPCGINWQGVIFKFTNKPDYAHLYKNGITKEQCNQFIGYIDTSECLFSYTLYNPNNYSSQDVIKEFRNHISPAYMYNREIIHLGKRSNSGRIYQAKRLDVSNLEWFKETFNESSWVNMLDKVYPKAVEAARNSYQKNSRIDLAKDEMDTLLAIKLNSSDHPQVEIEEERKKNAVVLEALNNTVVELDTIAFVWMTKNGID